MFTTEFRFPPASENVAYTLTPTRYNTFALEREAAKDRNRERIQAEPAHALHAERSSSGLRVDEERRRRLTHLE